MSTTYASVLAKPAIQQAVRDGQLFISNFDERQLNNSSYDIRLGRWFYREQSPVGAFSTLDPYSASSMLDPYSEESVRAMWGEPIEVTGPVKHIIMPPGSFMLGHTEEFIGGIDAIHTTMNKARSTTGRNGIQICACAGWGDIGYANRWTLELHNTTQRNVILRVGQRIGQIVFIPTTGLEVSGDFYHKKGKYQTEDFASLGQTTHAELDARWSPESMLPRAWEDWDAKDFL